MKEYKVVLFDLDQTLWDFNQNSFETLTELYKQHELVQLGGLSFPQFHQAFQSVNAHLWDLYDRGQLDRNVIRYQRFSLIFESISVRNEAIADKLSADYLKLSPTKSHLVEGALDILNYLKERYPLYVVTNGFTETQTTKARSGGIQDYFQSIVTSEMAGHKKPAKGIFDFVLNLGGFSHHEAIMIGDNLLTDITGAADAGIDTVHFNPNSPHAPAEGGLATAEFESKITYKISKLTELKSIL
jgi:YjjG family noncanonical pyrimidine nucleotidase